MREDKYRRFFSKIAIGEGGFRHKLRPKNEIGFEEEDIVVAVIGNRLDLELGKEEELFFSSLLSRDKRIKLAFFGRLSNQTQQRLLNCCSGKLKFFDYVNNLQDHLQSVDFFVNTRRIGGAGGAVLGLYAGILGCSIDYGDVGNFMPDNLKAKDYPSLLDLSLKPLESPREDNINIAHSVIRSERTYIDKLGIILNLFDVPSDPRI